MNKRKMLTILGVLAVWLISLACEFSCAPNQRDQGQAIALELTRQSLQMTQEALQNQNNNPPPPAEDNEAPPPAQQQDEDEEPPEEEDPDIPCNRSKFVSETIPDHTVFQPGDTFEKTWTVRNIGSCSWNTNYKFKFTQGERMGGAASQNLTSTINPNQTVTMSLDLTAPSTPGSYTGRWEFFDDDGNKFGWYSVVIDVGGPAPSAFAVTSVPMYMPHSWIDMGCPGAVAVKAEIFASGAGTVTYRFEDSNGGSSSTKSVTFSGAGSKIVDYTTSSFTADGDYTARIYIDNPNHQWFGPISFHINCTP